MLTGREVTSGDAPRLASFHCRNEFSSADEVEDYVRASLKWKQSTPSASVKVFYDHVQPQTLLAVVGYQIVDGGAWIAYIGVSATSQSRGLGSEVFRTVLDHLAQAMPGATASWRVHVRNRASQRMIAGIIKGLEPIYPPESPGYQEYSIELHAP